MGSLIIIAAMFALLWLLLIRPQRNAQSQRERLVQAVDVGDEILSSGGVYGTVRGVSDDEEQLHVEIAPGVEVRMDRRAVGAIVKSEESAEDEAAEAETVEGENGGEPETVVDTASREPTAHGTIERDRG